jgi:hypothetical protein
MGTEEEKLIGISGELGLTAWSTSLTAVNTKIWQGV